MESLSSEGVWERSGQGDISRQQFTLILGACVFAGLALTGVLAYNTTGWMEMVPPVSTGAKATWKWVGPINPLLFWVGVLVSGLAGVMIALSSNRPAISLLGYAMVAGPFGLMLGPVVGMYEPESVAKVVFVTTCVTGVMTILGVVIPESLESWGGWLFAGLSILLLGTIGLPLAGWLIPGFPLKGVLHAMDWFGVLLFSAYVIFDMNRAMRVPATVDNAVDCALALYLDIINLFLRLLRIMGQRRDK